MPRRRWVLRLRDAVGAPAWLVIVVPPDGGIVHASVGDATLQLNPEDISRVRQAYAEAQAVALRDRGSF